MPNTIPLNPLNYHPTHSHHFYEHRKLPYHTRNPYHLGHFRRRSRNRALAPVQPEHKPLAHHIQVNNLVTTNMYLNLRSVAISFIQNKSNSFLILRKFAYVRRR